MKLEKLNNENFKLEKSKMSNIHGGTSTTVMIEAGECRVAAENEYPDNGEGCPDYDKEPTLVN